MCLVQVVVTYSTINDSQEDLSAVLGRMVEVLLAFIPIFSNGSVTVRYVCACVYGLSESSCTCVSMRDGMHMCLGFCFTLCWFFVFQS